MYLNNHAENKAEDASAHHYDTLVRVAVLLATKVAATDDRLSGLVETG